MMKISFNCPNCQTKYSAAPEHAGRAGKCQKCGARIVVPKAQSGSSGMSEITTPGISKPGGIATSEKSAQLPKSYEDLLKKVEESKKTQSKGPSDLSSTQYQENLKRELAESIGQVDSGFSKREPLVTKSPSYTPAQPPPKEPSIDTSVGMESRPFSQSQDGEGASPFGTMGSESPAYQKSTSDSAVIKEISRPLFESRNWMKLLGICSMVAGGLYVFTIYGIIIAWLPIWMGYLLYKAAGDLEQARAMGQKARLIQGYEKIAKYFKITGIATLVGLVLGVITFIIVLIVGGLSFLSAFRR